MKHLSKYALAFALLLLIACTKDKNKTPDNNNLGNDMVYPDSAKLYLHLHTYLGSTEVDGYNITYELDDSRKVSLSKAQVYLTHIQLIGTNGYIYEIPSYTLLKVQETEAYYIAKVPVGNYKTIRFSVGLDSTANHSPAPAGSVLDRQDMWFGSTAQPGGFVFLNLQGKIDTTAAADGDESQMQSFVYRIGTDAHYQQVTMPDHSTVFSFVKDQVQYVHLLADYSKLFNGVHINEAQALSVNTATDNNTALGTLISNNIPSIFKYEE